MAKSRSVRLGLVSFLVLSATLNGCASHEWKPPAALDSGDDPAKRRAGYGNAELHAWWPLTAPEVEALRALPAARQGDAQALLTLALVASGDHRDAGSLARDRERIDRLVAEVRPTIAAAQDDWHRGYELNRAMHQRLFAGGGELGGYELHQAKVTTLLAEGHYNCLSSAMVYLVLARAFGLPVRAALVPTHVFVELGAPGGKLIEVETTSATGFDWVHDARFYAEDAAGWSSKRGLRPVTLDEYQHRTMVEPYQLMATAMLGQAATVAEPDRSRLLELAAIVDPGNEALLFERARIYNNEAVALYDARAWRTMASMMDTVQPAVKELGARSTAAKTQELVSWLNWYYAHALMIVGRHDEAVARADEGLSRLDGQWGDAPKLKNNYVGVVEDHFNDLAAKKDYPAAAKVFTDHREACLASPTCGHNAGIIYSNWSIDQANAGNWPAVRQVLQDCVAALPAFPDCAAALKDVEARHRF
jgi:hypothetical protein